MYKDKERKALLANMSSAGTRRIEKVIRFQNDDVPVFLAKLDKFEAESKKSRLVVG